MGQFLLKRIGLAVPTLLVVVFLVFMAVHLAPSDPVENKLGEKATAEQRTAMRHHYGLDQPLPLQFVRYVGGLLHGDFGESYKLEQPVSTLIAVKFPVTAQLAIAALLFSIAVGLPAGAVAAYFHNSWFDRAVMALVVAMVSIPSIVLGPLLILGVAVKLGWLPTSGWESPKYMVLPMIALGSRSAAIVARFMRSSLLDTLRQDYIRTAIAKGLSRPMAVWRHGIKNALLPVLTVLGTNFGALLTGSFVVETLFHVPGIGDISIESIQWRDYPVVQGMALLVAIVYVFVNLGVDVLYGAIDPRVRARG
ncbi:MAG TPA: ABC transporter permease [Chthonomonadaceae bacterium]|nr:ABC transporter permease [Chthonomonadaceae bacterium]